MRIRYSISLWNFTHYAAVSSLERLIAGVREQGYGIELWPRCVGEDDLYDRVGRRRLKPLLDGMPVSLHTGGTKDFDAHRKQIDAAVDLGGEVLVLHPSNLARPDERDRVDVDLAARAVAYAQAGGVRLALENGTLAFLQEAIAQVPGLGICLDTGHIYLGGEDMARFLEALAPRLIHLHIQDIAAPADAGRPMQAHDHYLPGTGGIPPADWRRLGACLNAIDYDGLAVFEVRPPSPFQLAPAARQLVENLARPRARARTRAPRR